jgi:hypothetical protein
MKYDHRSTAVLCIMILTAAGMFLGCNSPSSLESDAALPALQLAPVVNCPTLEDASKAIVAELDENCPRTRNYRHWGEENSCEKSTIGKMLDEYDGCFSGHEMKQLRIRIHEMRQGAEKPSDLPTPMEE